MTTAHSLWKSQGLVSKIRLLALRDSGGPIAICHSGLQHFNARQSRGCKLRAVQSGVKNIDFEMEET